MSKLRDQKKKSSDYFLNERYILQIIIKIKNHRKGDPIANDSAIVGDILIITAESLVRQINGKELLKMDMKFSIGDRVKIRDRDIVGDVVQMEYRYLYNAQGEEKITKKIFSATNRWLG